ncbi:LysR substrate-binding domain-containing protein, partial [Paraburkholderia sp. SIMBA_030]
GRNHPRAARRKALAGPDFGKEPLVLLNDTFATRRFIDEHFARHAIRPLVAIEVDTVGAIVEIVRRGQLATVLPDHI